MGNNLEQIANLLEITHDQIIIETDKTDEIKHQLGECFIHIDNALKGLDNFLGNHNAADALKVKQRLVDQLVEELEVLQPKELIKMVEELEGVTFGESAIKTFLEIAKEMSEVGEILVKHARSEEKEIFQGLFDYTEILKKKEPPDLVVQLRQDMMFVSAKMTDAVQYNPNQHIKDEWIKAARGLEEGAGNYQRVAEGDDKKAQKWVVKSPKEILPFVNIALDTMTNDETRLFSGEPALLKRLRHIHDQLDRAARKE